MLRRHARLRAYKPLRARKPMRQRRATPRLGRALDSNRLDWIQTRRCCAGPRGCWGDVVAHHHTGNHGLGQKADDDQTMPLCLVHHRQFHDGNGVFRGWTREQRRAWQDVQVAEQQADYERSNEAKERPPTQREEDPPST